ncbi:MAG: tRNA (adenosine(37)-N6)-threonylcarbamoyltransferase complex ATPase subunit type 1 TsaE [Odoribacteraceae bacterium]|jgi:tRNA threonylcarbamoyladenosine biosynthesis protein TsaE|nr:tRNA (adenosine(37)-N6)-threonylcarbamoyltransferase complex ATPase subunit type 1 TsaE [Odoribacteraceae bacterium]
MNIELLSNSQQETEQIAALVAPLIRLGETIILDGDLGTGKTHFVKGFAAALGSVDEVTSPTFSIANFYRANDCDILHVDLYRIETAEEFDDLGLDDYIPNMITLVEWGKKFADHLENFLTITFTREDDEHRRIVIEGAPHLTWDMEKQLEPFIVC